MRRVVGVDPGGTTGLAVVTFGEDSIEVTVAAELDRRSTYQYLYRMLNETDHDPIVAIAVEKFVITARTAKLTNQPDALKVIGAVEALALVTGGTVRVEEQLPVDAKTAWSNSRLAEYGLSVKGGHAKDALRHAMFYLQLHYPGVVVP